jgi:hypothetical protein
VPRPVLLQAYARSRGIKLTATDASGIARELLRADGFAESSRTDAYVVARVSAQAKFYYRADALADHAHPFTYCMENIAPKANVSDPEAFCANLVHEATGQWPAEYSK